LQIKYLTNQQIDRARWDRCINEAGNSRVYALSTYLDVMCSDWDALVAGDFEMVMPLPYRVKFGFHYLYQPAFTQQLGIFSKQKVEPNIVEQFLQSIPSKFAYWDIALNVGNEVSGYQSRQAKNYLLPLSSPYSVLLEDYNRNAKRNIRKAIDAGITVVENSDFLETIALHRKRFKDAVGANEGDYINLENLLSTLSVNDSVFSVAAKDGNSNTIASSTYLLHNNRIIFLINGNLPESLETGATHLLKDYVIKKFCGSDWVMDFEGSDHPQFAKFYEQFGAKEVEYYPVIVNNKLPWPLSFLKRSTPAL
jgi:hypothetical protein